VSAERDIFDRLRLIRSPNIGPVSYRQLVARFGSAGRALEALPDLASRAGGRAFVAAPADAIRREIEKLQRLGAHYLFIDDADYPAPLAELENAPPVLTYLGNIAFASQTNVAMVGARNASAAGCRMARISRRIWASERLSLRRVWRAGSTQRRIRALSLPELSRSSRAESIFVYPPEHAELQAGCC
jgi:DNA processing protein